MKRFFKEYYLLQQAVEDDYNSYLQGIIPVISTPIQNICIMAKEVDGLALDVLSSSSDLNVFEARIRLNMARRSLNFYIKQLEEVV
jgi:hypothetical protein